MKKETKKSKPVIKVDKPKLKNTKPKKVDKASGTLTLDMPETQQEIKAIKEVRQEVAEPKLEYLIEKKVVSKTLIQINKSNLLTYFAYGLIFPNNLETREIVRDKNRVKDAQSLFPDYLLLSDGFIDDLGEDQIFLDVQLTGLEKKQLIQIENSLFFDKPLPISRVSKILVSSTKVKDNILSSIETFPDTFIPESLFQVYSPSSINKIEFDSNIKPVPQSNKEDLISCKSRFDKILGMLAFMKNTELYFANSNKIFSDYTNYYFLVLHLLNSEFEINDKTAIKDSTINVFNTLLQKTSTHKGDLLEAMIKKIYNDEVFDKNTVSDFFEYSQNFSTNPQFIPVLQDAFRSLTDYGFADALKKLENPAELWSYYALAVLSKYNKKEASDKDALKKGFADRIKENYAEVILAMLGLYYGYASLPKQEEINLSDNYFRTLIPKFQNIKFRLESNFDKQIIESVYQFCFNQQPDNSFFKELRSKNRPTTVAPATSDGGDFIYKSNNFAYEDILVRKIYRLSKSDLLIEQISSHYGDTIKLTSFISIYAFRFLIASNIFEIDTTCFPPFKINKEKLIKALRASAVKNSSLLEYCLNSDKHFPA